MLRVRSEIERHRVRRTLTEVKNKLEEALRLSQALDHKGQYGEPTSSYRRR